MRLLDHESWIRIRLDLREGWEKVYDANEAQKKFIKWDRGPFWWYDESKQYVVTLKDWKIAPYNLSNTVLVLPQNVSKRIWTVRKTASDLNIILRLNISNKVQNWEEAEERYNNWEDGVFWLVTPDNSTIATLDFSKGDKPIISEYPKNRTNVRYQATLN